MPQSGKKGKQGWLIGLLIGAVVIGGGIGLYAYFSNKGKNEDKIDDSGVSDEGGGDDLPPVSNHDTVDLFNSLPNGSFPLRKGSKSKLVFILQKYLNCKFNSGLVVDGNFGSKTQAALQSALKTNIILSYSGLKNTINEATTVGTCEAVMYSKITGLSK